MTQDYLQLTGKIAIVTGGGRGIGHATSLALARHGVKVVVCDIRDIEGMATVDEIVSLGGESIYIHCDVGNVRDVENMVKKTIDQFYNIDILVNNAGIGSFEKNFEDITDSEWDRMIKVDLTSAFYVSRAVIPYMKKRKNGKIINISSGSGIIGCEYCSHYASAKAGLIGFTQSIAKELGKDHINVNVIATPTTDTPMQVETGFDALVEQELPDIPWGRIAQPEDIANMILYLSSEASEYVTGQVLAPNGGRRTPI